MGMKNSPIKFMIFSLATFLFISCQNDSTAVDGSNHATVKYEVPVVNTGSAVVTEDQFGDPLHQIILDSAFTSDKDSLLEIAIAELENGSPEEGVKTILGRRYMELARYEEAVKVFSENISRDPGSLKDHRFRGECYYYLQDFDASMSYLVTAKELSKKLPNQIEYEVDATSANMPVYNQNFNTFYYLALTQYVKDEVEEATRTFGYSWNNAANDDLKAMLACWLAISYRKRSMEGQAKAVFQVITPVLYMIQSPVYQDLGMMF